MTVHRETLKKKQKGFKSKHATKGSLKAANKGRVEKQRPGSKNKVLSKQDRRNISNQIKALKQENVTDRLKIFDGRHGVPRNIAVIPLADDVNGLQVVESLRKAVDGVVEDEYLGIVSVPRFKQRMRFFVPRYDSFFDLQDSARSADFVLFVLSGSKEAGDYGEEIVRCISAQGATTALAAVWNLEAAGNTKEQSHAREALTSWFGHFFTDTDKLYSLDSETEVLHAVRFLCQKSPKGISWRDERPYVVANKISVTADAVVIEGSVRAQALDPNQLLYLPGVGDIQITRIDEIGEGYTMDVDRRSWLPDANRQDPSALGEETVEMHEKSRDAEVEGAGVRIDGHHYVNELMEADATSIYPQSIKKTPKGMSDYQATWLLEGEDYGLKEDGLLDDNDDNEDDGGMITDEEGDLVAESGDEDSEVEEIETDMQDYDDDVEIAKELSEEEEARQLKEYRERVKEDREFPDELELEPTESAIERLKRYRGVHNLRNTEWDAREKDERTPDCWPRLARPGNLQATKNRLRKEETNGPAPGVKVAIYLSAQGLVEKVGTLSKNLASALPVTAFGLLPFEGKLAAVNMSITPDSEFTEPLQSKHPLVAQYGPRRVVIEPLYSQPGANADNDVYKYFRFLHPDRTATATSIAPVMLGNVPIVYYTVSPQPQLVGTGTIMDCDADRVIAKAAVLTGHPLKIHKKLVTIRYMFFRPEDVRHFKSVPLFTKWGRSGYIKESLGTHGYFKATFDGKLNAQDTISMALYKRVWPRQCQPSPY